jgi:toxin ParE1/3/4
VSAYRLTPKAQRDLDEIFEYTFAHWGEAQAEQYIRDLQAAIETVAERPAIAGACDEIRPGYRRSLAGSHVIFLKPTAEFVEIIRILHARMDFARRL